MLRKALPVLFLAELLAIVYYLLMNWLMSKWTPLDDFAFAGFGLCFLFYLIPANLILLCAVVFESSQEEEHAEKLDEGGSEQAGNERGNGCATD